MTGNQPTLGQAIDQILNALGPLDEGARRTALAAACMQLGIAVDAARPPTPAPQADPVATPSSSPPPQAPVAAAGQSAPIVDIRTFKEQKRPTSARQMACVVAFYLQELAPASERKDSVTAGDLEKYFKQAGYKLPENLRQILINLKAAGYMDNAARGEYKLNAVGYNLVAHSMPGNTE